MVTLATRERIILCNRYGDTTVYSYTAYLFMPMAGTIQPGTSPKMHTVHGLILFTQVNNKMESVSQKRP